MSKLFHYLNIERMCIYDTDSLLSAMMVGTSKKNLKRLKKIKKRMQDCYIAWTVLFDLIKENEEKQKEVLEEFSKLSLLDTL